MAVFESFEKDWIANSSVGCISGENQLTRKILAKLMRKQQDDMRSKEDNERKATVKPEGDALVVRKINGHYSFDNFDESQHLSGCPLKWFYNKKLSENNKIRRIERRRSCKTVKPEMVARQGNRNGKPTTPIDVTIHKMNLLNKRRLRNYPILTDSGENDDREESSNLTTGFGWKLNGNDNEDDNYVDDDESSSLSETFSELSCRQNYLPPRPLLGMKPLLTILLFPNNRQSKCCAPKIHFQSDSEKADSTTSPTLTIQSLDLSSVGQTKSKPYPRTRPVRLGCKTAPPKQSKRHLIPNQVMIDLRERKFEPSDEKPFHLISAKRSNGEKTRGKNSLPTLVYQLTDKCNYRGRESGETFEDLIKDITTADDEFKLRKYFGCETSANDNSTTTPIALVNTTTGNSSENSRHIDSPEMHLTCGKVRIFEKQPKRQKPSFFRLRPLSESVKI